MRTDHTAGEDTPTEALLRECAAKTVDALLTELRRRTIVQPERLSLQETAIYRGHNEQQFSDFVKRGIAPASVLFSCNARRFKCSAVDAWCAAGGRSVHEETVTASWRISMKTESVVINKGIVFDGRLFATPIDRGRYIGTVTKNRPQWLKDNPDKWWSVRDIQEQTVQLVQPVESENNVGVAPARPNRETSSPDVRKDGDHEGVAVIDTLPGDYLPPYQPTSLPTPIKANRPDGSTQTELLPPAKAATTETRGPKAETTPPRTTGRKRGRSGSRQLGKQKLPARISKSTPKLSPDLMRLVLDTLRECPILSHAADKAGIHRKTLKYWMERSEAGDDGYDVEWQSLTWRFHEHCKSAIDEAHDQLLAVVLQIANGEIFKTDPFLVNVLGYQGVDAYAQDENGNFIVEAVGRPNFLHYADQINNKLRAERSGAPRAFPRLPSDWRQRGYCLADQPACRCG